MGSGWEGKGKEGPCTCRAVELGLEEAGPGHKHVMLCFMGGNYAIPAIMEE